MKRSCALQTIASAGLVAGILDITSAFVIAAIKGVGSMRMLQGIASGLIGAKSFDGGVATAAFGLAIHFLIAFTAATVFYLASSLHDYGGDSQIEAAAILRYVGRRQVDGDTFTG